MRQYRPCRKLSLNLLSSLKKKIKGHNDPGLQKWKVRARALWSTVEIIERTCTEMLGQAVLSISQSMNAIHRNQVGCLDSEVKYSGISVHFLIRQSLCVSM